MNIDSKYAIRFYTMIFIINLLMSGVQYPINSFLLINSYTTTSWNARASKIFIKVNVEMIYFTVEPLNNGHFGTRVAVRYLEVVRYLKAGPLFINSTLIHYQIVLVIMFHQWSIVIVLDN